MKRRTSARPAIIGGNGGQGPAEMPGAGRDPEGPVEIQLSLRLSVSQPITNRLHYSHSDFKKTTKQKIGSNDAYPQDANLTLVGEIYFP
jgi:hypothetical protein